MKEVIVKWDENQRYIKQTLPRWWKCIRPSKFYNIAFNQSIEWVKTTPFNSLSCYPFYVLSYLTLLCNFQPFNLFINCCSKASQRPSIGDCQPVLNTFSRWMRALPRMGNYYFISQRNRACNLAIYLHINLKLLMSLGTC